MQITIDCADLGHPFLTGGHPSAESRPRWGVKDIRMSEYGGGGTEIGAAEFADTLGRLKGGETPSDRARAAERLARMAVAGASADPAGALFAGAAHGLASATHRETVSETRDAVRTALGQLLVHASRDPEGAALRALVRELADADRALLEYFTIALARFAAARRHLSDAAASDPLQLLARIVEFCDREAATHLALRTLAASPSCRRAVQVQIAIDQMAEGRPPTKGGVSPLTALTDAAAALREGRDLLAAALRRLPAPPPEALEDRQTLAAWRADRTVDLKGVFLVGARLPGVSLVGLALTDALLVGADLSGADLRGADVTGALFAMANQTDCRAPGDLPDAPRVPEPVAVAPIIPAADPAPDLSAPPPATPAPARPGKTGPGAPRKRLSLPGGLADAAKRATAPVGREDLGSGYAPFGAGTKKGRLATINAVNGAMARPDDTDDIGATIQIRPAPRPETEPVASAGELRDIAAEVGGASGASVVIAGKSVAMRDKARPKASHLTEADLLEITDLLADR